MNERWSRVVRALPLALVLVAAVWWLPPALAAPLVVVGTLVAVLRRVPEAAIPVAPAAPAEAWDAALAPLIEQLADGVVLLDAAGMVAHVNTPAADIVGRRRASMVGASLIQALRDHALAEVVRAASGEAVTVRVSATGHDVVARAVGIAGGRVRTVLVMQDITELEAARRARTDLVANLSHELRTPVAAARALVETLQTDMEDPAERAAFIDRLAAEIVRLGTMVDRLLRLSRLEAGAERFEDAPIDAAALLAEAAERVAPVTGQRGIAVNVAAEAVPAVHGDRERVLEVLGNLLDNAARYSPDGGEIAVRAVADDGAVRFEVADRGPGILPRDRERVFERFYTGDSARAAGAGTGLGLAIARHLVGRMGGRIWVMDRTPGATIAFTLPCAEA